MTDTPARTRTDRLLGGIERVGNRIPEPFLLSVGLFAVLAVVSPLGGAARHGGGDHRWRSGSPGAAVCSRR